MIFFTSENRDPTLANDSVFTAAIQDGAVTEPKLDDGSVTEEKIVDNAVTADKIASGSISETKLSIVVARILDREFQQIVNNSGAETTIFSYTVPANMLSTNRMLRLTMIFDLRDYTGTYGTWNFKVKFGTTTLWSGTTFNTTYNTNRRAGRMVVEMANWTSTTAQILGGLIDINSVTAATTGLGNFTNYDAGQERAAIQGTASESTSVDKTFSVTVTNSLTDTNFEFRKQYAILELL